MVAWARSVIMTGASFGNFQAVGLNLETGVRYSGNMYNSYHPICHSFYRD